MALEQWIVESPKTIDLELVRSITANLLAGSLDVVAHDEPGCRVEISQISGHDLKVAIDGDRLIIDHPQLGWSDVPKSARTMIDQPLVRVSVLVPAHCDVQVKATSANVLVIGVEGDVSITTVGGEHFCDRTAGKLHLTSAAGELSVRDHRGSVEAKTATGDVTVTGTIDKFAGNTVSGSTVLDLTGTPPTKVGVTSVSGATTVRLPEATNPVCTISTVTSKAQIGTKVVGPMLGQLYRVGTAADGEPFSEIRVTSVGGRVVVLREGRPWPADEPEEGPSYTAYTSGREAAKDAGDSASPRRGAPGARAGASGRRAGPAGFGVADAGGSASGSGADSADAAGTAGANAGGADRGSARPGGSRPIDRRLSEAADRAAAVTTEFIERAGEALRAAKASWQATTPNPNVDLAGAPRPTGNFTPPAAAPGDRVDPTETPTAASAAQDDITFTDPQRFDPDVPFVPGETTTAGAEAGFPPSSDLGTDGSAGTPADRTPPPTGGGGDATAPHPDPDRATTDAGAESVTGEGRDGLPDEGRVDTSRKDEEQA